MVKREWVYINHLAKEQGISHQRFYKVLKGAPIKRNPKGQVDRTEAMTYYEGITQQARRKRKPKIEPPHPPEHEQPPEPFKTLSYVEAQAKKETFQAHLRELEFLTKQRKLMPVSDVIAQYTTYGLALRGGLDALTERLPTRLAAESDWRKIKILLKKEFAGVLKAFENLHLVKDAPE